MKICNKLGAIQVGLLAVVALIARSAYAGEGSPSAIDKANARALYNEGLDLRRGGDRPRALAKLEAADALFPTPKTRLEVGREQASLGKLVEAYATLLSVANVRAELADEPKYAEARQTARALAASIRPRISGVVFKGLDAELSVVVSVDARAIPRPALTQPRWLDAGEHVVAVAWGDEETQTERVVLGEGEVRELSFARRSPSTVPVASGRADLEARPEPGPRALPRGDGRVQHTWALIVGGVGLTLLATGGVVAVSARHTFDASSPYCPGPSNGCSERGVDLRSDAYSTGIVATALLGAGAVGLVTGAALWLTAPHAAPLAGPKLRGASGNSLGVAPMTGVWGLALTGAL